MVTPVMRPVLSQSQSFVPNMSSQAMTMNQSQPVKSASPKVSFNKVTCANSS